MIILRLLLIACLTLVGTAHAQTLSRLYRQPATSRNLTSAVTVMTNTPEPWRIGTFAMHEVAITGLNAGASTLTVTLREGGAVLAQTTFTKPASDTTATISIGPHVVNGRERTVTVASTNGSDTAVSVTGNFYAVNPATAFGASPAKRFLCGLSSVGEIGDSYAAPGSTFGILSRAIFSAPNLVNVRGVQFVFGSLHSIATQQTSTGSPSTVASGAAYSGTSGIINNLPWSMQEWDFGSNIADFTQTIKLTFFDGAKINQDPTSKHDSFNAFASAGVNVESFITAHATPDSLTSFYLDLLRDGTNSNGNLLTLASTSVEQNARRARFRNASLGSSGEMEVRMLLGPSVNETGKEFFPIAGGWRVPAASGVMWGGNLAAGGRLVTDYLDGVGGDYTDAHIHAWYAAHSAEPIDTLIVCLGINHNSTETRATLRANVTEFLDRWITIGQQYTRRPFHVLWFTEPAYIDGNGNSAESQVREVSQLIHLGVADYGRPDQVQVIDTYESMRQLYGPVEIWGSTYLQNTGLSYLHFNNTTGAVAWGRAISLALEVAASTEREPESLVASRLTLANTEKIAGAMQGEDYVEPPAVEDIRIELDDNSTKLAAIPDEADIQAAAEAALASYEAATSDDVASIGGDPTPLAERPSAPNRNRPVQRSVTGGLKFDAIVLRVGDANAVWCLDFKSDLAQGTGITSVGTPTFSAEGIDVSEAPERTGDRPSKGVVLKFDPTTAGSYTMTMEVTYGDGQGTHTVQGTVTVLAGAE